MIIMDVQHVVEVDTLRGKDIFIHVFTAIRRNMIKNLNMTMTKRDGSFWSRQSIATIRLRSESWLLVFLDLSQLVNKLVLSE